MEEEEEENGSGGFYSFLAGKCSKWEAEEETNKKGQKQASGSGFQMFYIFWWQTVWGKKKTHKSTDLSSFHFSVVTEANESSASEMKTSGMKKQAEKEGKRKEWISRLKGEETEKRPLPTAEAPPSHQRTQSHSG